MKGAVAAAAGRRRPLQGVDSGGGRQRWTLAPNRWLDGGRRRQDRATAQYCEDLFRIVIMLTIFSSRTLK